MENDPFSNELVSSTPTKGATPLSMTAPYQRLIESMGSHGSKVGEYVDIINNIVRTSGAGSHFNRFQDVFYGFNRLPQIPELPLHKETQGLILFTKPELNLAYDNIAQVRQLSHLLTQDPNSAMNAVKLALDPITQRGRPTSGQMYGGVAGNRINSKLTDPNNPYMTLLSNCCISMSPPPDLGVNVYTSPEGVFKEQWIMNDSIAENNGYYDLTCTFANIKGNAVVMTFLTWVLYMGLLRMGDVKPHHHNRVRDRMDYNTRIERLKLDDTGRYVESWFHTGASLPKSISIGAPFGLNRLQPMEYENKEVTVQFASVGAIYNDPIQLWEFNERMLRWNPNLKEGSRKSMFYKVPPQDQALTNMHGYPLINLATRELEWWVNKEEYAKITKGIPNSITGLEDYTKAHSSRHTPLAAAKLTPK